MIPWVHHSLDPSLFDRFAVVLDLGHGPGGTIRFTGWLGTVRHSHGRSEEEVVLSPEVSVVCLADDRDWRIHAAPRVLSDALPETVVLIGECHLNGQTVTVVVRVAPLAP